MSEELTGNSRFDAMPSEQLEALLRLDAEGTENLDTDSLFYIMELLAARQPEGRSTGEAYEEFQREYLPGKKNTKRLWAVLGAAAAVAAIVILLASVFPDPPQPARPREFTLQNLTGNAVSITDADGNCAALSTISCDGYTITASIDAMDRDDGYSYYAVVTYSYCAPGVGTLVTEQFPVTTAEAGFEIKRVTCSLNRVTQVRSASASFYAVEKSGTGEPKLIAASAEFPITQSQPIPNEGFQ